MVQLTAEQRTRVAADFKRRIAACVPWTRNIKWSKEMNIVGASYRPLQLFPEITASLAEPGDLGPGEYIDSPGGRFRYAIRLHQRGRRLLTWWGPELGDVIFDADIAIPILFEREKGSTGPWKKFPWMSLTPGEILTLRVGTKLAKGKVVIGGLGLAHQLIEVSKRHAVTEIIVVERSHDLCDLILPRALAAIDKKVTVLIGDALTVIPTLEADVALVDIFPNYGCNHEATRRLAAKCKSIKKVWGWGTSELPRRG